MNQSEKITSAFSKIGKSLNTKIAHAEKWKAKYQLLSAGIENEKMIENTERMFNFILKQSVETCLSFNGCLNAYLRLLQYEQSEETKKNLSNLKGLCKKSFFQKIKDFFKCNRKSGKKV